MPSGYTIDMPNDVLIDTGVLSRKVSTNMVPFAVTRGGVPFRPVREVRNIEFDGKRSPIAGLDRVTSYAGEISGTFVQLGLNQLADLEPGASVSSATSTAGTTFTITPQSASTLIAENDLIEDLTLTYQRLGGGTWAVVFPFAICREWSLEGPDNDEGQVSATFEPRLGSTAAASSTDTCPWQYRLTEPAA